MTAGTVEGVPEPFVHTSIDALLAGSTDRAPLVQSDGKSGAELHRVTINGERFVIKVLDLAHDWTMRGLGDLGCATLELWRRGVLQQLPDCIDQPIVAVAHDPDRGPGGRGTAVLMRDIGETLVVEGSDPVPIGQHHAFLSHMARMHATFWDAGDDIEYTPLMNRFIELSPWLPLAEAATGDDHLVPRLVADGWTRLREIAPATAEIVEPLAWDPSPLVDAFASTPLTFVHGNWKFGNLGSTTDGRTVLIDWENPGRAAATTDLAWYLAINAARLPETKEQAIAYYRAALAGTGVDPMTWWDEQLALGLLGAAVNFGWEKALGGHGPELEWWCTRAREGATLLASA